MENFYTHKLDDSIEKKENYSKTEDSSLNNNSQLFQIKEFKSILDSEFYLIRKISESSSGKVYLGIQKDSLNIPNDDIPYYCIKIMNTEKINLNTFKNEINLLKRINHKNIVKIIEYGYGPKISFKTTKKTEPKEYYYIVMEYLKHGDLLKYIIDVTINENIGFGENFSRLIFSQLLDGLEAIHDLNICHRDIKLNNIFLGEDDYILKYTNFGMATENQDKLKHFLGEPFYTAPEILLNKPYYGKSADIFSLGITLFVLVTGRLPFKSSLPNDSLYKYIALGDYVEFWKNKCMNITPSFMELFDSMVAFDYTQRPSISEIRQSDWMKEINWELMPLLKQEFILREEKINFNKFNITKEDKNYTNKFRPNHNKININTNFINDSLIITKKENINNNYKTEGNIKIKIIDKSLYHILHKVKKFLKKEGYFKFGGNILKHEYKATNGDIDIFLCLKKCICQSYVILNYSITKGTFHSFEEFKRFFDNIKQVIEN